MVLPFIGASIATGIGALAGLSLGPYILPAIAKPHSYHLLREEVDSDNKVPAPDPGLLVKTEYRSALPHLEPWVTDPDYERVAMINRLVATVWPTMTQAIIDLVVQGDVYNTVLYPQIKAKVFDKFPFVEDIFLGPHSLRTGKVDFRKNTWLESKLFTVGSVAPRLGGMRVVPTADDEVLLETSAIWGSNATFDVTAILVFGRLRLVVPLQLGNISFKADIRVLLRPLVEKFPCLGGVSISLLRVPTIDFSLKIIKGVDIMALPFIPDILHAALKVILEPVTLPFLNKPLVPGLGMVLPNAMSFPIMPKFGLPDPPVGALRVTIDRLEGVRGGDDLYCKLEVRKGRFKQTRTVYNSRNPVFEEDFALIVDSLEYDCLHIVVYNDDMGWNDTPLADVMVPFGEVMGVKVDPATGLEVTDFQKADFIDMESGKMMKMPLKKIHKKTFKASASTRKSFAASKSVAAPTASFVAGQPAQSSPSPTKPPSFFSRLFKSKKKKDKISAAAAAAAASAASSDGEGMGSRVQVSTTLATAPSFGRGQSSAVNPYIEERQDEVGTIYFKVEFVQFNKPEYDDLAFEKALKAKHRDPHLSMFPGPPGRTLAMLDSGGGGSSSKLSYGVLTVQLIRCVDLAPEGAKDMATYVKMKVTNDEKDEEQISATILNETSPRWGDKFDFVLIPATSELHIQVFNKVGAFSNLVGSIFRSKNKEGDKDTNMGKVMINVEDVARNGRIKETWSLQDAERGYIELNVIWQTCHLSLHQARR